MSEVCDAFGLTMLYLIFVALNVLGFAVWNKEGDV